MTKHIPTKPIKTKNGKIENIQLLNLSKRDLKLIPFNRVPYPIHNGAFSLFKFLNETDFRIYASEKI